MSDVPPPATPPTTPGPGPAYQPPTLQSVETGLAITTLILGILGLVMCPLAGIVAIVTGIVALTRISGGLAPR